MDNQRSKFARLPLIRLRPSLLAILAATILLVGAVCALLYKADSVRVQEQLQEEVMARDDLRAKQLAGSVGQLTAAIIRLFDMALLQLRDVGADGKAQIAEVAGLVLRHFPPEAVDQVLVVDPAGRIVYPFDQAEQGPNLGDRPYFRALAENTQDQLYIGSPIQGRIGQKRWVIPLVRPIRKGGQFLGVVVIGLRPEYLSAKFAELSLNPGDVVALTQSDGTFMARNHGLTEALGRKTPADRPFLDPARSEDETYRAMSSIDNIPVDFAWKRLPEWDLIAVVALDERAELAPVRTALNAITRRGNTALAAILCFALMVAGLLLWAQKQQRKKALDQQRMERLLAEQKAMLENDLIGIVQVRNRTIVWANPAFEKMHGGEPGEFTNVSTRRIYPSEAAYLAFGAEAYPVLEAGGVYRTQVEHICKDGRQIWVDISGTALDREDGTTLWGFIDITDRKTLEFGLRQTNAELEQFAYVASHDLRQPLRMVTSYLRLIEKGLGPGLDKDLRKYLGYAVDGARRMDRLIINLLEYSRTGRSADSRPVQLRKAVGEAIDNLTLAIRESGAAVTVPAEMPTIFGDAVEITRLFENLIGNAIKYRSPDRSPEVTIGWRRQADGYHLWVADNGMGIAEDHRERAFQIFQRLVPNNAYEGSGIGLAVCKKIVERCGGKIWIESELGEGSTFVMTFPAAAS